MKATRIESQLDGDGRLGNAEIIVGVGDNVLYGGDGNDTLSGGAGDDQLFGGDGQDIFFFTGEVGHDVIHDFGSGDVIELSHTMFDSYAAVLESVVDNGHTTTLVVDADHSITLDSVSASELQPDDFRFI